MNTSWQEEECFGCGDTPSHFPVGHEYGYCHRCFECDCILDDNESCLVCGIADPNVDGGLCDDCFGSMEDGVWVTPHNMRKEVL